MKSFKKLLALFAILSFILFISASFVPAAQTQQSSSNPLEKAFKTGSIINVGVVKNLNIFL